MFALLLTSATAILLKPVKDRVAVAWSTRRAAALTMTVTSFATMPITALGTLIKARQGFADAGVLTILADAVTPIPRTAMGMGSIIA